MEKLISCCGLDCATCDARIATITNDNDLRAATAEKWAAQFNSHITAEMINCVGCRQVGIHFGYCEECEQCEICNCVKNKGFQTCAECGEMTTCQKVVIIHQHAPEAKVNLHSLK